MPTVTIEAAEVHLRDIIVGLNPGAEVTILQDGEPVAKLARTVGRPASCEAACHKKAEFWMAPDLDARLDCFVDETQDSVH